jgi:hypothetical protein
MKSLHKWQKINLKADTFLKPHMYQQGKNILLQGEAIRLWLGILTNMRSVESRWKIKKPVLAFSPVASVSRL